MILRKLDNGRFTNLLTSPRNLILLPYNLGKGKSVFQQYTLVISLFF